MKKQRYKEIRLYQGNELIGNHFKHIEFIYQKRHPSPFIDFIIDRYKSRYNEEDMSCEPNNYEDFIHCLKKVDFKQGIKITMLDEAPLLCQNFHSKKITYFPDDREVSIDEFIDFATDCFLDKDQSEEDQKFDIEAFKKECHLIINDEEPEFESDMWF